MIKGLKYGKGTPPPQHKKKAKLNGKRSNTQTQTIE